MYNMYRDNSIELNALGESWRCKKCQEQTTACLGRDRRFLVATECRKCQDRLLLVLGRNRGFLVATEFLSGSVS